MPVDVRDRKPGDKYWHQYNRYCSPSEKSLAYKKSVERKPSNMTDLVCKKAELLSYGWIYVTSGVLLPPLSCSASGPGAGTESIHLDLSGRNKVPRIRLKLTHDPGAVFKLVIDGDCLSIRKYDRNFISGVKIIPKIAHSPTHAFITTSNACKYSCRFCTLSSSKQNKSIGRILEIINDAIRNGAESVAFTSGVVKSPTQTVSHLATIIKAIRKKYPEMVIGVEPYITTMKQLWVLKKAGADELKLNLQSYDREIFRKVCPGLDYDRIMNMINFAAVVFGRGRVCSNIIVGLGESDDNIIQGVEKLASAGVVTTLRPLSIDPSNRKILESALGHRIQPVRPVRLLKLACTQKQVLKRYRLTTSGFKTMCHACACCDIEPFMDV